MIWTIFELIINLFQGFYFTWFLTAMFIPVAEKRWFSEKRNLFPFLLCGLLTSAALSSYLFLPMPKWDLWIFAFLLIYTLIHLKGPLFSKVFWLLILIFVSRIVTGLTGYLAQTIVKYPSLFSEMRLTFYQMAFVFGANLLMAGIYVILVRIFRKRSQNNDPSSLLLITFVLCIFQIEICLSLERNYHLPDFWSQVVCLISLLIAVMTIITRNTLLKYARKEQEYRYREQLLKDSVTQADEMREMYTSMLRLRHDMNAYVQDLREMIDSGKIPGNPEFFEAMEEQLKAQYSTGNVALDSVLSVKAAKMSQLGIVFQGSNLHYTGGMNLSDPALCSLISNMLDNACEALVERKDRPGEHTVYLQFSYHPGGLMIICENPLLGVSPRMRKKTFLSTKKELDHGLGISIMQKIVADAKGQFDIVISDDLFRVLVLIPPVKKGESEKK